VSHAHAMRASFRASQYSGDVIGKWQVVSSKGESSGRGGSPVFMPAVARAGDVGEVLRRQLFATGHSPLTLQC
jgi:hypothetical protein